MTALFNLRKRGTNSPTNVTIRGVSPIGMKLRPEVKLAAGRMFRPGSAEIVTGKDIAQRSPGRPGGNPALRHARLDRGGSPGRRQYRVQLEIWGDIDQMQQAFRRPIFSTVILRLRSPGEFKQLKERLESDPRLPVQVKREITFYEDQSKRMADFIRLLGLVLTIIFSLGAILGAMITMYAAVATRTLKRAPSGPWASAGATSSRQFCWNRCSSV